MRNGLWICTLLICSAAQASDSPQCERLAPNGITDLRLDRKQTSSPCLEITFATPPKSLAYVVQGPASLQISLQLLVRQPQGGHAVRSVLKANDQGLISTAVQNGNGDAATAFLISTAKPATTAHTISVTSGMFEENAAIYVHIDEQK